MQLTLVAANATQAGVTVPDGIWVDANYVYFANFDGHLRVADKRQSGFPVIADVPASIQLYSVRGDATNVYATSGDGKLFRFSNQPPFAIQSTANYASDPLVSLDVDPLSSGSVIVSQGGATSAADAAHVYVAALNSSDSAMAINKASGHVTTTFQANPFDSSITAVFDRFGARVGTIQNPTALNGQSTGVAMYSESGVLALFTPGCCGDGVFLYDASTLAPLGGGSIIDARVASKLSVDTVAIVKNWLILGTEGGTIDVFDISNPAAVTPDMPRTATINLRTVTGKTGPEDIEIRALWAEDTGTGVRIYASSDWGNSNLDPTYRAQLPTFFVLDLK